MYYSYCTFGTLRLVFVISAFFASASIFVWTNQQIYHSPLNCWAYYRKYILQNTQPSQYRYTQLQYRFEVISQAPSMTKKYFLYSDLLHKMDKTVWAHSIIKENPSSLTFTKRRYWFSGYKEIILALIL